MPAHRTSRARTVLTPGSILDGALVVVHREGVAGLSIRKLAAELDVTPMAVYYHFVNKDSILLGVIDRVVGEAAVTAHGVPRSCEHEWLLATFRSMYDTLLVQPGLISLLAQSIGVSPNARAVLGQVLGVLQQIGLDAPGSIRGFHALMSYTLGAASLRVQVHDQASAQPELSEELTPLVRGDFFEDGLEVVLSGLRVSGATP
ncbi:MAG: TetR/AcrR family transcriptional regulator [Deltaproteobacteria bacterium]|nr:TetR/AcrR family transcriptional regulator [Deltaproteobacteria bacterium]MBW2382650.1 TetR/AcrR family transcriptional regulator [Deltaproteobacteria bacterium]